MSTYAMHKSTVIPCLNIKLNSKFFVFLSKTQKLRNCPVRDAVVTTLSEGQGHPTGKDYKDLHYLHSKLDGLDSL